MNITVDPRCATKLKAIIYGLNWSKHYLKFMLTVDANKVKKGFPTMSVLKHFRRSTTLASIKGLDLSTYIAPNKEKQPQIIIYHK